VACQVRIARFSYEGQVAYGVVEGDVEAGDDPDAVVTVMTAHPFAPIELSDIRIPLAQVKLLAPVLPSKVVAIGKNYADHVAEMGGEAPPDPVLFLKPSTSVIGPRDRIVLPHESSEVHHEAELAVVIGRLCKDVPVERAHEVVLGYTCANDVTARDLQRSDGQWARAKGFDTFCPIGPWVVTDLDPADLRVMCAVGDDIRQDGRTSSMIRDVATLVAFASRAMTLLPGDVLLTGTPAGVGPIVSGDSVTIDIDGIGALTNPVVAA
jgi:2-keto-4-pentenoate hydratase/2-oxohepta-3-ene-1,7-dioic acid hydratase in catechol pathway